MARLPHWFNGPVGPVSRRLLRRWSHWSQLDRLEDLLNRHAHLRGRALLEAALRDFDTRYLVDDLERQRIPEQGRVIVVANHPLGGLDGLLLMKLLCDVRPDFKVAANAVLSQIPGLADMLIPVDVFNGQGHRATYQSMRQALESDQALLVFPAGSVSRFGWRGIRDAEWQRSFVSLSEQTGAPVVNVRIEARNSTSFYAMSWLSASLGTTMLPKEFMSRRGARVPIRIDRPWTAEALRELPGPPRVRALWMQQQNDALRHTSQPATKRPEALAHRPNLRFILRELSGLTELGRTRDQKRILCGRLRSDSALMQELAIARERSFRAVGEGTGRHIDQDRFDAHYEQILLWDDVQHQLVGGYRVARCKPVLADHGLAGLYTASLFRFPDVGLPEWDTAMELGRSFVLPEYWGGRSLDYLWLGIGAYLRAHPDIRHLFGPVSISASMPVPARQMLVAYCETQFRSAQRGVRGRRPFDAGVMTGLFQHLDQSAAEQLLMRHLQALGTRIPTLYKQYTDLCEPGGVSFLAFSTDPDFADAVDGLVWVDLAQMSPKKRQRYLQAPSVREQAVDRVK
ncbi:GNAT family N-acyltransferase [Ahniella affigens]|nr:lysophospholipid acyltransferase family protein [Ahniella affigens]